MRIPSCIRLASSLLFALSLCLVSARAQELSKELPRDSQVLYGTLPNGLTYYIRKNPQPEHRVEIRLAVKAGSILEDDDQQGLAHFTEHMAFNGTKKWPKNDLINFLESSGVRFGAHLNAYTSFDETVYMLQLPTNKGDVLEKGIDVLSEWAHGLAFDPKEIDKERGVVIEEWRLGRGANERIENKQLPVILNNSRYADRITIGKKEILDTFKYSTLKRFYNDWYRPDLMAVVIVGDVDPDQMLAEVKKEFAGIENPVPERPRPDYTIPPHTDLYTSVETDKELTTPSFNLYFLTQEKQEKTVKDYRRSLVGSLCDIMIQHRIDEIVEKGNPPFSIGGSQESHFLDHTHAYSLTAFLKPDSIMSGIRAILREGYQAKNNGFTPGELERAKREMMTSIEHSYTERDKTNSGDYVREYVSNFLTGEPFPGIAFEQTIYKTYLPTITLEETNLRARRRMDSGSVVLTLEAPQSDTIHVPSKDALLNLFHEVQSEHIAAYIDDTTSGPLLSQMPTDGKIVSEKKIKALGITEWTLSNGVKVLLKPTTFKQDEIKFEAIAPGGTSLAPDNDLLSAQFAPTVVIQSGIGQYDLPTLQKMLSGKTAVVRPFVNSLEEGVSGNCNSKDMETMFQLLYLNFTSPRLDTNAATAYLTRIAAFLTNMGRNPQTVFADTVSVTMAQHSPRRLPISTERLSQVRPAIAYQFYRDRFKDAGHFTFFFVGSFKPETLRPFVEKYIASLPATEQHETWRDEGVAPPKGNIVKKVYKGIDPKSTVRINITGPFVWSLQNRFDIAELAEVLKIKLREDIREDKSGVYGIGVQAVPERYPEQKYMMSINFGCAPERVDELVAEVMKQLDTATMRPFDTIYIHKVQEMQRGELETSLKENDYWLLALATYTSMGENPIHMLERRSMIDMLSPENVLQSARKYLNRKNMVQVELFPENKN